jgi:hypothetical protein
LNRADASGISVDLLTNSVWFKSKRLLKGTSSHHHAIPYVSKNSFMSQTRLLHFQRLAQVGDPNPTRAPAGSLEHMRICSAVLQPAAAQQTATRTTKTVEMQWLPQLLDAILPTSSADALNCTMLVKQHHHMKQFNNKQMPTGPDSNGPQLLHATTGQY